MERNILVECVDMLEEIKDLRRRIQDDQKKINQLSQTIVSDSVTCGKKGKKPAARQGVGIQRFSLTWRSIAGSDF